MKHGALITTMTAADIEMIRMLSTFARTELGAIVPVMPGECLAYARVRNAICRINEITMKKGASAITQTPPKNKNLKPVQPLYTGRPGSQGEDYDRT